MVATVLPRSGRCATGGRSVSMVMALDDGKSAGTELCLSQGHTQSGIWFFPRQQNTRGENLNFHFHIVPRIRMSGALPQFPCNSSWRDAKSIRNGMLFSSTTIGKMQSNATFNICIAKRFSYIAFYKLFSRFGGFARLSFWQEQHCSGRWVWSNTPTNLNYI